MRDFFTRALTRRIRRRGLHGNQHVIIQKPNEKLVLAIIFAIAVVFCLTGLEIAYLLVLRAWSSEIFAGITGLSGTVMGVFLGQKAG